MTAFPTIFPNCSPERLRADSSTFARCFREQGLSPFCRDDTSAGMEYELQVAVQGAQEHADDLPRTIRHSNFFRNTEKRAARGDFSRDSVTALNEFLDHNVSGIWENSWVRFEEQYLGTFAAKVLATDFLADKR